MRTVEKRIVGLAGLMWRTSQSHGNRSAALIDKKIPAWVAFHIQRQPVYQHAWVTGYQTCGHENLLSASGKK